MQRRKWDANTKAMLVLDGLKGKSVAERCTAHPIRPTQYSQGRDPLLAHAAKAFEVQAQSPRAARLARENARWQTLGGALTLELNKSDEGLG